MPKTEYFVLVQLTDSSISRMDEIEKELTNRGMGITSVFPLTGVFLGTATDVKVLKEVVGVKTVEKTSEVGESDAKDESVLNVDN